jgi:hypothetical protein
LHVFVDGGEALGAYVEAGFLSDFADQARLDGLVESEDATWRFPVAVVSAADGEDAG